jgi:hypothetical protein
MSELPPFNLDVCFDPSQAWHDKIEWCYSPCFLRPRNTSQEIHQFSRFLEKISLPPRSAWVDVDPASFGWLFLPSAGIRAGFSRNVRKGIYRVAGRTFLPPLLSGQLNLKKAGQGCRKLEFRLEANPSRLAHFHPRHCRERGEYWRNVLALSETGQTEDDGAEFSLDGKANWVPRGKKYKGLDERGAAFAAFNLKLIEDALNSQIALSAAGCARITSNSEKPHSIRKLETYWEFSHSDPIRLVADLSSELRSLSGKRVKEQSYLRKSKRATFRQERERNCLSIILSLGRGEELAVYAKTNRRVRFEMRQNFTENSACLRHGYTAQNLEGVVQLLRQARAHCAQRMNEVFRELRRRTSFPSNSFSATTFLADTARALRRSDNLGTVLTLLCENGKIEQVAGLRREIKALRDAGIIEIKEPKSVGSYWVTSPYLKAVAQLKRKGAGRVFDARDR